MNTSEESIKRYYRGKSSLEEERDLKEKYRKGLLPEDPALGFGQNRISLPEELMDKLHTQIHQKNKNRQYRFWYTISSAAALFILIIFFKNLWPAASHLQLSENDQRRRFEEALQIVGRVLEEQPTESEKILYEDTHLIITTE